MRSSDIVVHSTAIHPSAKFIKGHNGVLSEILCSNDFHQEIVETLVFPVRSDHVMDPTCLKGNWFRGDLSDIDGDRTKD